MNKYIISTGIALTLVSYVSAEQNSQVTGRPATGGGEKMMVRTTSANSAMAGQGHVQTGTTISASAMMTPPVITTGDSATDAIIKALQVEMEVKIKAIREEYQAKIKAAIGDKKVTIKGKMGSSTKMMEGHAGERDGQGNSMHGSSTKMMRHEGEMMHESSAVSERPMHPEGSRIPVNAQVQGESTGGSVPTTQAQVGLRGFFGKIFGR